mmetsp:Transcript_16568/g.55739  ORF Transcript_16568/g.55739 Transcript_16568/m.55739 type:complete len:276 (+) Transcript_16568:327-1154(+)
MARGGGGDERVVALGGAAHVVRPSQQQRLDRRELERVGGRYDRPHRCWQRARHERQPIDVGEEACGRHLQEVLVRAEPLVRLSLQQRGAQLARGRPHGVRVVDLAGQHQGVHLDGLVGAKGWEAGQQLVQEHAEGPPVDGEAVAAARDHLGRGVLRRAAQRPGAVRRRGEVRGEPKVDELEVALGVEDEVLRLEVAVNPACEVAGPGTRGKGGGGGDRLSGGDASGRAEGGEARRGCAGGRAPTRPWRCRARRWRGRAASPRAGARRARRRAQPP